LPLTTPNIPFESQLSKDKITQAVQNTRKGIGMRLVFFRPGLKPKSRPSRAQIGRAKPGQNNGLKRLLAWPLGSPGQGQAAKPRLSHNIFLARSGLYLTENDQNMFSKN
jgi:hypothetical protein